uniref:WGS project CAEQ00000000 data, annotated contig 1735 n=1 Tax=Trypanosoma congolense (strain IL3000) TaxID=1068625 RepID=F9W8G8_TRYCI|nr:unnamed protein product [Trypanosoma congolense IL3000]
MGDDLDAGCDRAFASLQSFARRLQDILEVPTPDCLFTCSGPAGGKWFDDDGRQSRMTDRVDFRGGCNHTQQMPPSALQKTSPLSAFQACVGLESLHDRRKRFATEAADVAGQAQDAYSHEWKQSNVPQQRLSAFQATSPTCSQYVENMWSRLYMSGSTMGPEIYVKNHHQASNSSSGVSAQKVSRGSMGGQCFSRAEDMPSREVKGIGLRRKIETLDREKGWCRSTRIDPQPRTASLKHHGTTQRAPRTFAAHRRGHVDPTGLGSYLRSGFSAPQSGECVQPSYTGWMSEVPLPQAASSGDAFGLEECCMRDTEKRRKHNYLPATGLKDVVRTRSGDVAARCQRWSAQKEAKLMEMRVSQQETESKDCTFAPHVCRAASHPRAPGVYGASMTPQSFNTNKDCAARRPPYAPERNAPSGRVRARSELHLSKSSELTSHANCCKEGFALRAQGSELGSSFGLNDKPNEASTVCPPTRGCSPANPDTSVFERIYSRVCSSNCIEYESGAEPLPFTHVGY